MEEIISGALCRYAAEKYESTLPLLGKKRAVVMAWMEGLEGEEKALMEFLYGTMPICDAADYEPQLIYSYVRHALFLRRQEAWTRSLPEDVFLNYVLYHRVNNENITDCRGWFYEMIHPLVEGLSPMEAVKAVNYWCAEQATYTSSDGRTLSPVGVFQSGSGRCGEESTFLVTALRSVGIAARQVYTPNWAHCDDNHAWVEAWVDGEWYFLGACEPEEVLNKGWFTNASSRAMMVHTRVFSGFRDEKAGKTEEITERKGAALFFNDTHTYARTSILKVRVKDSEGNPVPGARVSFELLNMAEYCPVSVLYTDENGEASLRTGYGSIYLHISKGERCCDLLVRNEEAGTVAEAVLPAEGWEQVLKETAREWQYMEHTAPRDYPVHPVTLTREQKEQGRAKKHAAESLRQKKLEGFSQSWQAHRYPGAEKILELSYGNYPEICRFLEEHPEKEAREFLSVLAKKDYRDIRADILTEHYDGGLEIRDFSCSTYLRDADDAQELFLQYVWNPRIRYEMITPYRSFINDTLSVEEKRTFSVKPEHIWEWIQETVSCQKERSYSQVVTSPTGVLRTLQGSAMEKKILFVAICRTLGVPARLNPASLEAEYYGKHGFCSVVPKKQEEETVRLRLKSGEQPEYFVSWTIGRLSREAEDENGETYCRFETLDYTGKEFSDGELELELPGGVYRLLTSVRLPSGNQLEARRILDTAAFPQGTDGRPELELELEFQKPRLDQMVEKLALENFALHKEDDDEIELDTVLGGRPTMLAFLEEGMEPTEHLLNELKESRQEIAQSGLQIAFVVAGKEAFGNATFLSALECLPAEVYYDDFEELPEMLARRMYTDPERLPLVALISPDRTGRYASSGYNVGSVSLMLRIAKMLTEKGEE